MEVDKTERYYEYVADSVLETAVRYLDENRNDPKRNYLIIPSVGAHLSQFECGISYESAKRRNTIDVISFERYLKNIYGMRKEDMEKFWEIFGGRVFWVWDDLPIDY